MARPLCPLLTPLKITAVHRWPLSQEDRRVLSKQELIKSRNSLVRQPIGTGEGKARQREFQCLVSHSVSRSDTGPPGPGSYAELNPLAVAAGSCQRCVGYAGHRHGSQLCRNQGGPRAEQQKTCPWIRTFCLSLLKVTTKQLRITSQNAREKWEHWASESPR